MEPERVQPERVLAFHVADSGPIYNLPRMQRVTSEKNL